MQTAVKLVKGMQVLFGRPNGAKTPGVIVKINPKKVKVRITEARGKYPAGTEWGVPPSMIVLPDGTPVTPKAPAMTVALVLPEGEHALMEEIAGCYFGLSPENLSCDGEASWKRQRLAYRAIKARLDALCEKLGRAVTEDEAMDWYMEQRKARKARNG